ncbi:MAG: hypothetical protein ACFFAS_15890 [Promethearchaeota archaeon]
MLREIEERIEGLEKATSILEDHLNIFGDKMELKPREFIAQQINNFKREIKIRRDFPIF